MVKSPQWEQVEGTQFIPVEAGVDLHDRGGVGLTLMRWLSADPELRTSAGAEQRSRKLARLLYNIDRRFPHSNPEQFKNVHLESSQTKGWWLLQEVLLKLLQDDPTQPALATVIYKQDANAIDQALGFGATYENGGLAFDFVKLLVKDLQLSRKKLPPSEVIREVARWLARFVPDNDPRSNQIRQELAACQELMAEFDNNELVTPHEVRLFGTVLIVISNPEGKRNTYTLAIRTEDPEGSAVLQNTVEYHDKNQAWSRFAADVMEIEPLDFRDNFFDEVVMPVDRVAQVGLYFNMHQTEVSGTIDQIQAFKQRMMDVGDYMSEEPDTPEGFGSLIHYGAQIRILFLPTSTVDAQGRPITRYMIKIVPTAELIAEKQRLIAKSLDESFLDAITGSYSSEMTVSSLVKLVSNDLERKNLSLEISVARITAKAETLFTELLDQLDATHAFRQGVNRKIAEMADQGIFEVRTWSSPRVSHALLGEACIVARTKVGTDEPALTILKLRQ